MITSFLGEIAALGTAFVWAISATFFTSAGRRIGSSFTNRYRTYLGSIFLMLIHYLMFRSFFPSATSTQVSLLVLSGAIGLVGGDSFLFQSYIDIGPRLTLLIYNFNPFMTAFLGQIFLKERMGGGAWAGMVVTLAGIIWVLIEERKGDRVVNSLHRIRGIVFAALSGIGQSVGFIIAKPAMLGSGGLPPLSATLIRVASAAVIFMAISSFHGGARKFARDFKDKKAVTYIVIGSFLGPCIGIWLSLTALKLLPSGIAATLIATLPVMILPVVMFVYKEKVSWRVLFGTVMTTIGVALLFYAKK